MKEEGRGGVWRNRERDRKRGRERKRNKEPREERSAYKH